MADDNHTNNGTPRSKPQVRSGLYVRSVNGLRLRDEKVRRLVRRMKQVMPWIDPADEPACRQWAQLEVLADMAHTILRKIGITSNGGEPRRLLTDFRQLRLAQLQFARELGLTPLSRSQLKLRTENSAFDLAAAALASGDGVDEDTEVAGAAAETQERNDNGERDERQFTSEEGRTHAGDEKVRALSRSGAPDQE
jgi:hypothetical protein